MKKLKLGYLLNNRYKIDCIIGNGGQGAVYKALDTHIFDKVCAVKEILRSISSDIEALILFKKEAIFLSALNHNGLPKILDFFKENNKYYIVMEYIEGKNLEEILNKYPEFFSEKRTIEIALKLCDILFYTHNLKPNPVIFRDIKPANIIYSKDRIVLIDFGTARFFNNKKQEDTFHFGTIGYAPPEQYGGLTDTRSDIYSFGITLYQLLTGNAPLSDKVFPKNGLSVLRINGSLSKDIDEIIKKMTISDINKRYQDVKDIKEDLLKCSSIKLCPKCGKINSNRKSACTSCTASLNYFSDYLNETYQLVGSKGIYEFNKPVLTIGRNADNDIVIKNPAISRNHAVLKKEGNGFLIADMGSKSGTFIKTDKGIKRIKNNLIKPGWSIRLGNDVEFEFKIKQK